MKILYIGSFFETKRKDEIWENSKKNLVFSGNSFQKSLIEGFLKYANSLDTIINLPAIGSFPLRYKKIYFQPSSFEKGSTTGINAGFFNLTLIKNYSIYKSIKKQVLKWTKQNVNERKIIIVYSLIEPYIKAAVSIKKKYPDIEICCIVLDLPEYFGDQKSIIHKTLNDLSAKRIYRLIPNIDSFVLLTEPMATALGIQGKKPWLLLEGLYLPQERLLQPKEEKTILYTGKLDARFGIIDMLEAFSLIPDDNYKLWICGDGTDREAVENAAKRDKRIKYFGLLKQEQVLSMQTQATLLLNPRKGNEEYTKYSFPSKTMEYMASGTPTIMYPLPGVPKEYQKYLILIPDNSLETLRNVLIEWCEKPQKELNEFGEQAKSFIINNKNAYIQSARVLSFIKEKNNE